ncbi:MAG TPA: glycosyltransferase [Bryobacteraceae bacterium]|nr:glycosyltransferase [Bryobacteraceae bacterium]
MEPNKISVVIVSFNRVEQLRRSLAALTAPEAGLQVVVVDNGSRDGSANLSDEFPDVRFSKLPRNFGLTRALNIGIRAAERDYILLLHDDVLIEPAAVNALAEVLEQRQDVAAVCPHLNSPQIRPLPGPGQPDPPFETPPGGEDTVAACVSGAALMARAHFFRSMGKIDERYGNYGSAMEICAQIRTSNRKILVLGNVTAVHGSDPSPMAAGALKGDRAAGIAAYLGKHYGMAAGLAYRMKSFAFTGTKIDGSG